MTTQRVVAIFRRVAQEIVRDRPSIALLFIAPLVITGLVTFILREGETPTINAVIVSPAGPPGSMIANRLSEAIIADGGTATQAIDEPTARDAIEDGTASVAVVLPADLASADGATITVITKGLDPAGEGTQLGAVQRAILASAGAMLGQGVPTVTHLTLYGAPSTDPVQRFAPALVAFFAYFFVYILTGVSFLRERTGGTLERLMATPVSQGEVVVGYLMGFGAFAMLQVTLMMIWALGSLQVPAIGPLPAFSIGLGIQTAGSPLVAFLVVVLLALGAVSLGILISTVARSELQIIEFIPIVLVPQFLLSGIIFPLSSLPSVIQPFAGIMPLHYAVEGLRLVFVAGAGVTDPALLADLLVLFAFAVGFAVLASLTIRREVA